MIVLKVALIVFAAFFFAIAVYYFMAPPEEVQAPASEEVKSESKDAAEETIKSYLEEFKLKDKVEMTSYFSERAFNGIKNLSEYYGDSRVKLDTYKILKAEKAGEDEFGFLIRETQKDSRYGIIGYTDNKYIVKKSGDGYIIDSVEAGIYVNTGETKDWKIVKNEEKGYEITYPENFFYQEPEITVSKMAGSSSLQGCYARTFRGFIVKKVEIEGMQYCLAESTGKAAGSVYVDSTYTNVKGNRIATLHFIVRYLDCGAVGTERNLEYANCDIANKKGPAIVERVVSTFKITLEK